MKHFIIISTILLLSTAVFAQAGSKFNISFGDQTVQAEVIKTAGKKTFFYIINPAKDQWTISLMESNPVNSTEHRKISILHPDSGEVIATLPLTYNSAQELETSLVFKDFSKQLKSLSKRSNSFQLIELYEGPEGNSSSFMLEFKLQK